MGNKASKVTRTGRVLTKTAQESVAEPFAKTTRLDASRRKLDEDDTSKGERDFADRLKRIGQVQYKPAEEHFKPASEDNFTITLEARRRLEDRSALELEKNEPRKLLSPTTINAILMSLKEGDSIDRVTKAYNLDASVLSKLQYLSIPERSVNEAHRAPNQLLDSTQPADRKPVRRRRKENS